MTRIYFVGAHSTGKTTMARYVSNRWKLPMITEMARAVLAERETSLDSLRTDMELVNDYQRRVFHRQMEVESQQPKGFVSDRAFDNLAYAAEHSEILPELMRDSELKRYMNWVAKGIVFFIRPQIDLVKHDGTRAGVNWEAVVRIDGMVKVFLEMYSVRYMPINTVNMQERVRQVEFLLDRVTGIAQVIPINPDAGPNVEVTKTPSPDAFPATPQGPQWKA